MSMEFLTWDWMDKFWRKTLQFRYFTLRKPLRFCLTLARLTSFNTDLHTYLRPCRAKKQSGSAWRVFAMWRKYSNAPFNESGALLANTASRLFCTRSTTLTMLVHSFSGAILGVTRTRIQSALRDYIHYLHHPVEAYRFGNRSCGASDPPFDALRCKCCRRSLIMYLMRKRCSKHFTFVQQLWCSHFGRLQFVNNFIYGFFRIFV